jgi:hypothetical protein
VPAGGGAAHRADTVRREEPGADRAAAAGPGEIGVAEYLVELPPREMLEAKSCTRPYGWRASSPSPLPSARKPGSLSSEPCWPSAV